MAIVSARVVGRVLRGRRAMVRIMVTRMRMRRVRWYFFVWWDWKRGFWERVLS